MQNSKDNKGNLTDTIKSILEEYMRDAYESNSLKLPTEKELAEMFNVSRITIRAALDAFEQKGMVIRRQGSGTYINPEAMKIKISLTPGTEFSRLIQNAGYESKNEVIEAMTIKPDDDLCKILNIAHDEEVFKVGKIYYANNYPSIVSIDYVPKSRLGDNFDIHKRESYSGSKSVFDLLYDYNEERIVMDRIEVQAVSERSSRKYLQNRQFLRCESVLLIKTVNFNEDNDPIMYTIEIHDTNFIKFNLMRVKNIY